MQNFSTTKPKTRKEKKTAEKLKATQTHILHGMPVFRTLAKSLANSERERERKKEGDRERVETTHIRA